jgi:putative transcriptional regulator
MSEVGDGILQGLQEALAYVKGEGDLSKYRVHHPKILDVAAIRKKTGMTQERFAQRFGVSVNTLRHWEQGTRYPEGPARTLLKVIDKEPEAVERALRAA